METTTLPLGLGVRSQKKGRAFAGRWRASSACLGRYSSSWEPWRWDSSSANCGSSPSSPSAADSLVSKGLQAESDGQYQQAQRDFVSAAAQERSAIPYYDLGVLYQRDLHDPVQAAVEYKRALSIQPKNKNAMFNLAVVDAPSQPQAAENLYNQVRLLYPKDALAYFNLGVLLIQQNQPTPGHLLLKKAISLDPALAKQVPAGITP